MERPEDKRMNSIPKSTDNFEGSFASIFRYIQNNNNLKQLNYVRIR